MSYIIRGLIGPGPSGELMMHSRAPAKTLKSSAIENGGHKYTDK